VAGYSRPEVGMSRAGFWPSSTIAGVRYLWYTPRKEPAAVFKTTTTPDLDYPGAISWRLLGEITPSLYYYAGKSYITAGDYVSPYWYFNSSSGPMGKIRLSNHHTQLWKNRGKQEVKTAPAFCLIYRLI